MDARTRWRGRIVLPVAVFASAVGLFAALSAGPAGEDPAAVVAVTVAVLTVPVVIGVLVGLRVPDAWVGAALVWVGAAPAAVFAVELWGETSHTAHPWVGAHILYVVKLGAWVWNLAGFTALCLVFPNGPIPGRRGRVMLWWALGTGVAAHALASWLAYSSESSPLPTPVEVTLAVCVFAGILAVPAAAVRTLVGRYRSGDATTRLQLRWLVAGASTVPVLLAAGWAMQAWWDAPPSVAYTGFLVAMLVAVPASVATACCATTSSTSTGSWGRRSPGC
ncbi:hypothetical protein [Yinghuangia seranimata]|uniref:hypothetical protein n=1 Tax=Yinghuangia seranimata TaxID=408067 RepID=UPI00248B9B42|nr:hypothetical protein [Yinghuangia seranimata]MDI2125486.1 hypothetical protein [Yinghuangia seranimata]